ncbi:MAG TPA: riboflavin synthase [Longimicrobiales bacterium]|nr:riboflavin synthase [Longimicrobiales bacterium]
MFTGIIETTGHVVEAVDLDTTRRFTFRVDAFAGALQPGHSVAVDGACLTAVAAEGATFSVDVIGTTLERTIAGRYQAGTRVNLERAMSMGERLDGHLVQGHVDGVGHLERVTRDGEYWLMDFRIPSDIWAATILHGSIALNGVSLTVSDMPEPDVVQIGIIPYTWEQTNLGGMTPGDPVNVEGDLIGKYVGRILATRGT